MSDRIRQSFAGARARKGPRACDRAGSGSRAARGLAAETAACNALTAEGWTILGRRLRTASGEIDAVAERAGLLAIVEVKSRPTFEAAAHAIGGRQQARIMAATEIVLGENPEWGRAGVRFDVMLVDAADRVRRIPDAFRLI